MAPAETRFTRWVDQAKSNPSSTDQGIRSPVLGSISRVPPYIRAGDPAVYTPRLVSFGPYHHGSDPIRGMEDFKLRLAWRVLRKSDALLQMCLYNLRSVEERIRKSYSEKLEVGSEELAEIMLVDGCAIIGFFWCREGRMSAPEEGEVTSVGWFDECNLHTVMYDMLLLENQIPFFILDTLIEIVDEITSGNRSSSLSSLAIKFFSGLSPAISDPQHTFRESQPIYHLLHLFHVCLLKPTPAGRPSSQPLARLPDTSSGATQSHASGSTSSNLPDGQNMKHQDLAELHKPKKSIPSATALSKSGVRFKKMARPNTTLPNSTFVDVAFTRKKLHCVVKIPSLDIYDYTNLLFRNLIALEQTTPTTGNKMTSYVVLMCQLIQTTADVEILKRAGIIVNMASSDKEVARLFNSLCMWLHWESSYWAPSSNHLLGVFKAIEGCMDHKRFRWYASFLQDYCETPFMAFGVVVAAIIIVITVLQLLFNVLTFFGNGKERRTFHI